MEVAIASRLPSVVILKVPLEYVGKLGQCIVLYCVFILCLWAIIEWACHQCLKLATVEQWCHFLLHLSHMKSSTLSRLLEGEVNCVFASLLTSAATLVLECHK